MQNYPTDCPNCRSLEEEKAQQLARSQENERSMVKAWDEIDLLKDRLTRAEARVAVMRAWIEDWLDTPFFEGRADWEQWVVPMRQRAHALLSPDAGGAGSS